MALRLRTSLMLLTVSFAAAANAADHFLTIGGGYSPVGNQISLEKNVLMFQQTLAETYPDAVEHDIFFADGNAATRDVQLHDPNASIPRANQLAARIFQDEKYFGYQYRSNQVPGLSGASNKENIERWFNERAAKLGSEDRLIIYLTAHGGKASDPKKAPKDTSFYMWNTQKMQMTDLVKLLDKVPAEVPVVVVMVQCYSGGFANIVFNEGDEKLGFTAANRCGFYATVHDRVAAGCTPDINEADYHEYSSYFWSAIRGRTRTGQPVDRPDFDQDGHTSFAEAHAYALLESVTLDISIKTSDAFLRAFSKLGDGKGDGLLHADSPYEDLLAHAASVDAAVLQGLSATLGLAGQSRAADANKLAEELMNQKKKLDGQRREKSGQFNGICKDMQSRLKDRWPEIANKWHPRMTELLTSDSADFVAEVESHPRYSEFVRLHEEMAHLETEKFDLDRRWVKCQRLIRALENVAYAANLPQVADQAGQDRYADLVAAEAGVFGPAANPVTSAE